MGYLILILGVALVLGGLFAQKKKKEKHAKIAAGSGAVLALVALIYISAGTNKDELHKFVTKSKDDALGYGVGKMIAEKTPEAQEIVLFTYGSEDRTKSVMNAFTSSSGKELIQQIVTKSNPSLMRDPFPAFAALNKQIAESKADVAVIDMGLNITSAEVEGFKGKILVISLYDTAPDEALSKDPRYIGFVKQNPNFIPEGISSNPRKAFEENYQVIE